MSRGKVAFWTILCSMCLGAMVPVHKYISSLFEEVSKVRVEINTAREEVRKGRVGTHGEFSAGKVASSRWIGVQKKARDCVVQVITNALSFNWLEPYKVPEQGEGRGSGFFIDSDGHFLTNYHVVAQALRVQVQIPVLGKERLDAVVIGVSPERDLALLRLTDDAQDKVREQLNSIPYLKFGSSDDVERGQEILTLGYPLAMEHLKSTQGIVSGWERVSFAERAFGQLCFQMTAPINPGSSGGPSLNESGEVIGINFAGAANAQNVGYVIPIDDVKSAVKDLHKVKLLRRPRLGCALQHTTKDMSKHLKFPEGGGLYVARVMSDSLMEKIGIKCGDVLREISGHLLDYQGNVVVPWSDDKVSGLDLFNRMIVGDEISFVVYRDGKRKEFSYTIEKNEVPPIRFIYPDYEDVDYEIFGGVVVMEMTLNHIMIMGDKIPPLIKYASSEHQYDKKLLVTNLFPTSQVHNMRGVIEIGSIIDEVNGKEVSTLKELRSELKKGFKQSFVTILTEDKRFAVLNSESVTNDERRLAGLFQYDKTHSEALTAACRKRLSVTA